MQKRTLGLITAPDYAEEIIDDLIDDLPRHLKHYVNNDVTWEIECHVDSWTGGTNRADRAIEWTKAEMSNKGWDYAITLTDLPLFDGKNRSLLKFTVMSMSHLLAYLVLALPQ